MKRPVLLDTGPLVAILDRRDRDHEWAKRQVSQLQTPFLTCEAVLSEAYFLLRRVAGGSQRVTELLVQKLVLPSFHLDDETAPVTKLLTRYANVPMSLADACLVRMAEQHAESVVFTLDRIARKGSGSAVADRDRARN